MLVISGGMCPREKLCLSVRVSLAQTKFATGIPLARNSLMSPLDTSSRVHPCRSTTDTLSSKLKVSDKLLYLTCIMKESTVLLIFWHVPSVFFAFPSYPVVNDILGGDDYEANHSPPEIKSESEKMPELVLTGIALSLLYLHWFHCVFEIHKLLPF